MAEILIVDDDRINLALARKVMEQEGHAVFEARSGEEAVALALKSPPDLIVMDIMMHGMGGITALSKLRQEKTTLHIPVVALTALAMPGDEKRMLASGFDAYVSKPIKIQSFARQVQALLEQHAP